VPNPRSIRRTALFALAADAACVVLFTTVGRRNHDEGLSIAGIAETSWPFLTGAGVGWLLARGWRRPTAVTSTGLTVWVCTVAVGMLLRRATSEGTALSFVLVASLATGLLILGWRGVVAALSRRAPSVD
jgi:hypothetical protein